MRRTGPALLVAVVALLLAAVSAFGAVSNRAATTRVTVSMTEFKFALTKKTVPKGTVVFKVVNKGTIGHDFKIAGKKTRILRPGASAPMTVVFRKAGRYSFMCTLPTNATAGMKGVLVVK